MASSLRPRSKVNYKTLNDGEPLSLSNKNKTLKTLPVLAETFYAERLIDRRSSRLNNRYEYLVKWQDYHISDSTWEVEGHLSNELRNNFVPTEIDDSRLRQFSKNFDLAIRDRLKSKSPECSFLGDFDVYRHVFGQTKSVVCNLSDFDKLALPDHWYYDLCKDGTGKKLKFPVKVSAKLCIRKIYVKCGDKLVLKNVPIERIKVFCCTESCSIDNL